MYEITKKLKRYGLRTRKSARSFKCRLAAANKMCRENYFVKMTENLNPTAKTFIWSQYRFSTIKPKGRRFSLDEKTLSLLLLKRSPKGYGLLQKIFILPSKKTLNNLLRQINMHPGINKKIMNNLKIQISKLPLKHRICSLIFDEMSISSSLKYNEQADSIVGFVDNGQEKKRAFADHVLVFMAKKLIKKWKQPVSFSFCEGTTKTSELKVMLKQTISALQEIGLIVVCTICDQGKGNQRAIQDLQTDTLNTYNKDKTEMRGQFFEINGQKIVPLFDPPHLLKCVRNNLIKYNLKFTIDDKVYLAKWKHLVELFDDDQKEMKELRELPKLDNRHVNPKSREKMKVNLCTQVFSQRVASSLRSYSKRVLGKTEVNGTALLFLFLDRLFDSLNGSRLSIQVGKELRGPYKQGSPHEAFWNEALKVLDSMIFINPSDSNKTLKPDCLKNWIKTIRGFQSICKRIQKEYSIKFLLLRNFNQDPLENFFGSIRSHGLRNINPTVPAFVAAYKTLILNNFMSTHSMGANCEVDISEGALSTLGELLLDEEIVEKAQAEEVPRIDNINLNEPSRSILISNYCCGYVLKNLKNHIYKGCKNCKTDLEAVKVSFQHSLIKEREFIEHKELLKYPSFSAARCFIHIKKITFQFISEYTITNNLLKKIRGVCLDTVDFNFISCEIHKRNIISKIIEKTALLVIYNYIKEVNKILTGKNIVSKNAVVNDSLKTMAIIKRDKIVKFKLATTKI